MLSKVLVSLASLLSLSGIVLAHGGVTGIQVGSTSYAGWQPYNSPTGQVSAERPYSAYDPILDPLASTLHCNDNGAAGPSQQTITLAAGSTIRAIYAQWTHLPGPYTVYLADCGGNCTSVNTATVKWFKIYELGLISGTLANGTWANGLLLQNLYWDTVIPANLRPGNYFIRWETLALHQANTPQFYPECAQLQITGSGSVFPTSAYLVSIPGAWGANDPGVMVDIYSSAATTTTTYLIPGPRVYPGFGIAAPPNLPGSGAPATTSNPPQTTTKTVQTTLPPQTSTAPPQTTPPPTSGTVAKYGQCGGQGYTGPTTCVSSTCTVVNQFYSQCL